MLENLLFSFLLLCLSYICLFFPPCFSIFFLAFKIPKVKFDITFYLLFIFNFFPIKNKNKIQLTKNVLTHVIFWGLVYMFQTCILMCIMCLMQNFSNYETPICN
jgi:hypothetical protein